MTTIIRTCDHCKKEVPYLYDWPRFFIREGEIQIMNIGYYQFCKDCSSLLIQKIDAWQELKDDSYCYIKRKPQE